MHVYHIYHVAICFVLLAGSMLRTGTFQLITCLYNEKKHARISEYLICIDNNLTNRAIDNIHVIYDTSNDDADNVLLTMLKYRKISISYQDRPQTFGDCFTVANKLYPNSNVIICNADIYFNETLSLLENVNLESKFLALTRWNVTQEGGLEIFKQYSQGKYHALTSARSQDVWIFSTPIRKFSDDNIRLGMMACDAAIAHEARAVGLDVMNPCLTIQACHLHLSGQRNYDPTKRMYPAYPGEHVPWITLDDIVSQITQEKNASESTKV